MTGTESEVPTNDGDSTAPSSRRSSLFSTASFEDMNLELFGGYQVELETGSVLLDPLECVLFEPPAKRFAGDEFQSTGLIVALHGEMPSSEVIQEWGRTAQQLKLLDLGVTLAVPNLQMSSSLNSEDITGLVNAVMRHCGAKECMLIGKGWGGPRAITYAEENPERIGGLLLMNPWTPSPAETSKLSMPVSLLWMKEDDVNSFDEDDAEAYVEALNGRCAPTTFHIAEEGSRLDGVLDADDATTEIMSHYISATLLLADMSRPENEGKALSAPSRRLSRTLPQFLQPPSNMEDDEMVKERLGFILPQWIHCGLQGSAE